MVQVHSSACHSLSSFSNTICWRDSLFSTGYSFLLCWRLVGHTFAGPFLGFVFCSVDLCVCFCKHLKLLCPILCSSLFRIKVVNVPPLLLFFFNFKSLHNHARIYPSCQRIQQYRSEMWNATSLLQCTSSFLGVICLCIPIYVHIEM